MPDPRAAATDIRIRQRPHRQASPKQPTKEIDSMSWFTNRSIRTQLLLSFGAVLVLLTLVAGMAATTFGSIGARSATCRRIMSLSSARSPT